MANAADALIAGGGLAGAAVAIELAQAGRSVVLLEKTTGPHDKVCGEFLSREALHYLRRLGVGAALADAVSINTVRLITHTMRAEAKLPFVALGLSRRRLDEELLQLASDSGVDVQRGVAVDGMQHDADGWRASLRNGQELYARHAFLATGKHDLRGFARPPGNHAGLVAFKMYYRLTPQQHAALGGAVELILFPGGYAGLQAVEDDRANLSFLVTTEQLRACGGGWKGLLQHLLDTSRHLAQRLQNATALLPAPLAISSLPYGHLQRDSVDGLWRVGDQAAVIPSFCGDGMSIALHSGALAAQHFLQGNDADVFQRTLHHQLNTRLRIAVGLSRMLVNQPWATLPAKWSPALLRHIALMTRIPDEALTKTTMMRA